MKDSFYLAVISALLLMVIYLQQCRRPAPLDCPPVMEVVDTFWVDSVRIERPDPVMVSLDTSAPSRPPECPPCSSDSIRTYVETYADTAAGIQVQVLSETAGILRSQVLSVEARPTILRPAQPVRLSKTEHLYLTGGLSFLDAPGVPVGLHYAPSKGLAAYATYDLLSGRVTIGAGVRVASWRRK